MEKKNKYEGFTLSLALVDALPVLLFGASSILIGLIFKSPLFIVGACLVFLGGFLKVLWKIVLATKKKDIPFLNKQMKYTMLTGFALIIVSLIANAKRISFSAMGAALTSLPSCIFFLLFVADDKHIRDFFELRFPNLIAQLFVSVVRFRAKSQCAEFFRDFSCIIRRPLGQTHNFNLNGANPERERTRIFFN